MADCWWMFGEGEVRYASGISGYHCAICSVIKIDESLKDEAEKISSTDFNSYLASKIREDKTYFVFLFGTTDSSNFENERYLFDKIDISKKYAVLTGINPNYIGDHEFIYPSIISVDEVSSSTKCTDFDITKN
jgi:hypothetical protein